MELFADAARAVNAFLAANTYLALLVMLFVEEAGVPLPVPGETLIAYTGFQIAAGGAAPLPALACILAGVGAGSSILYLVARWGGQPLLRRVGQFLRIDDAAIEQMYGWMHRHPAPAVAGGRLTPGLRMVTSVVAGTFRLHYPTFLGFTLASMAVWGSAWLAIGATLGANYDALQVFLVHHQVLAVAVFVTILAIGGLALWHRLGTKHETPATEAGGDARCH